MGGLGGIEWLDIDFLIQKFFMENPYYAQGNRAAASGGEVESEDDYTDEEWEPDTNYNTDDDEDL